MSDKFKEFFLGIAKGYESSTYISKLCTTRDYNPNQVGEYLQFPVRIKMESRAFSDNVSNQPLAGQLGEVIAFGEFNHLISLLVKKSPVVTMTSFKDVTTEIMKVDQSFNPHTLLIPIDKNYYLQVHNLISQGLARYKSDGLYLNIGIQKIRVIWSSKSRPFKDIFLLGNDAIEWTYKPVDAMDPIKGMERYRSFEVPEEKRVDFKYYSDGAAFDIVARTVGKAQIDYAKVKKFDLG